MKKILLVLPFFCLLTACVDLRTPTTQSQFQTQSPLHHAQQLSNIHVWQITGALSITENHQQPAIANYTWNQQSNQRYHITLNSSLNLYQIVIDKNGDMITLTKNGVLVTAAKTPEKLMQNALGWSLPVTQLQYWIKGLPAPTGVFTATYDRYGHLVLLKQSGFTVQYQSYQTSNNIDFPQLISVQNPLLFAKIVIKRFSLGSL